MKNNTQTKIRMGGGVGYLTNLTHPKRVKRLFFKWGSL